MLRCVLIDGRAGSGKSVLAGRTATRIGAQLLALDDLYPGWRGLAAGSATVSRALREGGYRRYDWASEQFAEWVPFESDAPLVIEGCGAITRENLSAAKRWARKQSTKELRGPLDEPVHELQLVQAIWLEAPEPLRRARALGRDGEIFAPHWREWATQEDAHFELHQPWLLADEVRSSR